MHALRSLQNCVDVLLDLLQPIRVNPVWSWTLRGADMKRSNCVGSELSTLVSCSTLRTLWVTLAAPLTQSTVLLGHPCGPALWQFSHKMWCQYEANVPQDVSIFCLSALNWSIDQSKENFHILLWYFVGHDFFHSSLKCFRSRARWKFVPIFIIFLPGWDLGRPKLSHKWLHCHNPERRCGIAFGPASLQAPRP